MESNAVTQSIELIARGLEVLGVAVIGIAFLYATMRGLVHIRQRKPDAYQRVKIFVEKALQLGLDFWWLRTSSGRSQWHLPAKGSCRWVC